MPETFEAETFEAALQARAQAMADACTLCGKCVEVCPATAAAGVRIAADPHLNPPPFRGRNEMAPSASLPLQGGGSGRGSADSQNDEQNPVEVIGGVIDIIRHGDGSEAARKWASGCLLSGDCIKACDYGVNPRFLLYMARIELAHKKDAAEQRKNGVTAFRTVARDVGALSQLQLEDAMLARLGQSRHAGTKPDAAKEKDKAPPDFVFYTGCNVLKTPHIALYALDIMDALGISYEVMGGPTHCCGIVHMRAGDVAASGRLAENTVEKLSHSRTGQVISWCPSCQVQFTETTLPNVERMRGAKPFEMSPFTLFLHRRLDALRPLLKHPVPMRVALHRHPGVAGVVAAAQDILRAVPGIEIVDLDQPAVGLQSNNLRVLPEFRRQLQLRELAAAAAAGVDALVAVYHSDHRELCAHERDWPFRILNIYEIVGQSMGLHHADDYKRLKMMQDADLILADCRDLVEAHGLDPAALRVSIQAMLDEQPAPLRGHS